MAVEGEFLCIAMRQLNTEQYMCQQFHCQFCGYLGINQLFITDTAMSAVQIQALLCTVAVHFHVL
jgi:hypothetical protein